MSAGYLYSANTTTQTPAIGANVNMGSAIHRFGCVKGTSTPFINVNGITTILSSAGFCPSYFNFSTVFNVIPSTTGTVTITAYQDGTAIPGATSSVTVAATDTDVVVPIVFGVRLNNGVTSSNITYVISGVASNIINAIQVVDKK